MKPSQTAGEVVNSDANYNGCSKTVSDAVGAATCRQSVRTERLTAKSAEPKGIWASSVQTTRREQISPIELLHSMFEAHKHAGIQAGLPDLTMPQALCQSGLESLSNHDGDGTWSSGKLACIGQDIEDLEKLPERSGIQPEFHPHLAGGDLQHGGSS